MTFLKRIILDSAQTICFKKLPEHPCHWSPRMFLASPTSTPDLSHPEFDCATLFLSVPKLGYFYSSSELGIVNSDCLSLRNFCQPVPRVRNRWNINWVFETQNLNMYKYRKNHLPSKFRSVILTLSFPRRPSKRPMIWDDHSRIFRSFFISAEGKPTNLSASIILHYLASQC